MRLWDRGDASPLSGLTLAHHERKKGLRGLISEERCEEHEHGAH